MAKKGFLMQIVLLHAQGNWGDCSSECPMEEGCPCIFPFKWNGIRHDACTMHDTPNGKPWCAIEVDDQGEATDAWAACSHECPFEKGKGHWLKESIKCEIL